MSTKTKRSSMRPTAGERSMAEATGPQSPASVPPAEKVPMLGKLSSFLKYRRVWLVLAILALLAGARISGLDQYLSIDVLRANRRELMDFVQANQLFAAALYVATYIGVVAFSLPGATFLTLTGGFLFGAVAGTLLTVLGATVGATIVFELARSFSTNSLARLGPRIQLIANNLRDNAWSYLLVLRLVPLVPFVLVNLIPAFVGVRSTTFVVTTFFGIMPGTTVYSLAGAGLGTALEGNEPISFASILSTEVLLGLVGLAALALAAIPLKKWLLKGEAAAE
ncbi:TVP38/TMEM64 family protein [Pseudorhodoplanes sp.]|uniref:TVP38/TMEM64 family protein n=1 Tax=Pseudorhodoplanes sp. TaxID=1934341 RepID=UPI003D12C6F8